MDSPADDKSFVDTAFSDALVIPTFPPYFDVSATAAIVPFARSVAKFHTSL
ncbi:MAG: hypothetical protein QM689_12790 [Oscillospiraceae bacterium]